MPERSHREVRHFRKHIKVLKIKQGICEFCEITNDSNQFVTETESFRVIRNIFPYSYWDHQRVADHLMIIPKAHTDTLSHFTPEQASEFVKLVGRYENQGYNVYARAPKSKIKSVIHQHTHLIKPKGRLVKVMLFIKKPFARVVF